MTETITSDNLTLEARISHLNKILTMSARDSQAYHLANREMRGIVRTIRYYEQQFQNGTSLEFQMAHCHLYEIVEGLR